MASLDLAYIPKDRAAQISTNAPGKIWDLIVRACEDNSQFVTVLEGQTLRMPWWAFLSARAAINYHVKRHNLALNVDVHTKGLLKRALESERRFDNRQDEYHAASKNELISTLQSKGFKRELTDEQTRNVLKLIQLGAAATFSVPGAGKTTEALAYYFFRKSDEDKLLIVCPKNVFAVWEEQINLCAPQSKLHIERLRGGEHKIAEILQGNSDVLLINYDQLRIVVHLIGDFLSRYPTFLFLDESHKIKAGKENPTGRAVLSLAHFPIGKLILSGTPMPNAASDLVSQFQFLYPEIKCDDANVKSLIETIFVRTTKKELNLPELKRFSVAAEMLPAHRRLYDLVTKEIVRDQEKTLRLSDRQRLRRAGRSVMRLLQIVSNPSLLVDTELEDNPLLGEVLNEGDSPKLEMACLRARELAGKGEKCIIWSSFRKNVELVSLRLRDLGADYIHGGVEAGDESEQDTREAKIKRFHDDPKSFVLVANPAACGEGISLHRVCHHAIYIDRTFNAAQYLQSEDRIHRIGLEDDQLTNVEILFCPGTIDETVQRRLQLKVERMGRFLDDPDLSIDPYPTWYEDPDSAGMDIEDLNAFIDHIRDNETSK